MAKTEYLLKRISELEKETGIKRTIFAVCPNSMAVIKASFRAAKRNNAPIYFATTLNQVDGDGGYTGMNQSTFTKVLQQEADAVNYTGMYIVAIDHGGPWLKDIQTKEKWDTDKAMNAVKKSFEDAVVAEYDLIHVDPTVDIFLPEGANIDICVVAERTADLINHVEKFRRTNGFPKISYEVGTEEVHGGLADQATFDTFLVELKNNLKKYGLEDVWPVFIVGKVGTDLHTAIFDPEVAKELTEKVKRVGSYIKGHYTDGVTNPEEYPQTGMGGANVGPEFTISEYEALEELEVIEKLMNADGKIAQMSHITSTLSNLVDQSNRWQKWLFPEEKGKNFSELSSKRKSWIVKTCCRYIWQHPSALVSRQQLYDNLKRFGIEAETIVLNRIEHDMDKYFRAFNLVNLNDYL